MGWMARSAWCAFGLLYLALSMVVSADSEAAVLRHAKSFVFPATETLHDDLYAAGDGVEIQGTVDGDLVVAGQTVRIAGIVTGDVIAAARDVKILGSVGGSVRAAGSTVTVDGTVGHDVVAGCGTLVIGQQANIGRDAIVGAGSSDLGGRISRDVRVGTGSANFSGSVGGTVYARAKEINLADGTVFERDLFYTSKSTLVKSPNATVKGRVEQRLPRETETPKGPGHALLKWLRGVFGFALLGLLFFLLFRTTGPRAVETAGRIPWACSGLGVILAIALPISFAVLFVIGIIFGGWWIGIGLIVLYLFALCAGYVVSATSIGKGILDRIGRAGPGLALGLVVGLVVLGILSIIPLLGMLAVSAAAFCGLGAIAMAWYRGRSGDKTAPGTAAARPSLTPVI